MHENIVECTTFTISGIKAEICTIYVKYTVRYTIQSKHKATIDDGSSLFTHLKYYFINDLNTKISSITFGITLKHHWFR